MKKLIFTIATVLVATVGTTTFANAATKNNVITVLNNTGNINKIEVRGNVEVIVANGQKDEVTVSNNYYAENALVQGKDGVLRISSYGNEKLVVYVKAADLRSIAAFDNAVVKSDGRFSAIDLQVTLSNNAYAALNLDNFSANVTVNDNAKADVSGFTTEFSLNYSAGATVNHAGFVAENISETRIAPQVMAKAASKSTDELVIVED
jgi:hypothetical protein